MQHLAARRSLPCVVLLAALLCATLPVASAQPTASGAHELLPLTAFAPSLLGMYRKVMEIDSEIKRFSDQYGLDFDLARAVVIHESGGNGSVVSSAGARGYFQVMPATFRELRVDTNIEAGIKYLSRQVSRFGREDYALAAYNGGPGRVSRNRPMYLETLQYVFQVGDYRNALKLHDASIRRHALGIGLQPVQQGDDWWSLSERVGIPIVQLRLHNPFLANRALRAGQLVAHPPEPRTCTCSRGTATTCCTGPGTATTICGSPSPSRCRSTTCATPTASGACRACRPARCSGFRSRGRGGTPSTGCSRATT